jgi:hypothetical protein
MGEWTNTETAKVLDLYLKSSSIIQAKIVEKDVQCKQMFHPHNTLICQDFCETASVQVMNPPG